MATGRGNPNIDTIPAPSADPIAAARVLVALKNGMESLAGQRGGPFDRAATLSDLIRLGLATEEQIRAIQR